MRQRETEHEQGRGREREGDTESKAGSRLQAPGSELSVQSPMQGLNPPTVRSCCEPKSKVPSLFLNNKSYVPKY